MAVLAAVKLWGTQVGAIADSDGRIVFEYDPLYMSGGRSISPMHLPLRTGRFEFPELRGVEAFGGLPGVFADRLPDKFGGKLVEAYFNQKGIPPSKLSPVQKLLYVGKHGCNRICQSPSLHQS